MREETREGMEREGSNHGKGAEAEVVGEEVIWDRAEQQGKGRRARTTRAGMRRIMLGKGSQNETKIAVRKEEVLGGVLDRRLSMAKSSRYTLTDLSIN
jgi:hypothetical protein